MTRMIAAVLLALVLASCGSGFVEGTYVAGNQAYVFGPDGKGTMSGVMGKPMPFRYKVTKDELSLYFGDASDWNPESEGKRFLRIDRSTIQRGQAGSSDMQIFHLREQ